MANSMNPVAQLTIKSLAGPQTLTADVLGAEVDTLGLEGEMLVGFMTAAASTADTLDVTLHHSDTSGGSYAAATLDTAFTQITDASTGAALCQVAHVDRRKLKRFVKINLDVGGGTISFAFGGAFLLGATKY